MKKNAELTVPEIVVYLHALSKMSALEVALSAAAIDRVLSHLDPYAQARVVAFWLMHRLGIDSDAMEVATAHLGTAKPQSQSDADALRDLGIGDDHAR